MLTFVYRSLLSLSIALLLIVGAWRIPQATAAPLPASRAAVVVAQGVTARETDIAAMSERLESIAAELRRLQPVGAPVPSVAAVAAGSGELAALGVAERVIAKADGLADFDAQMEAQWRAEAAEMTRQGVSAVVVQRHLELIAEVKARSAEFHDLSASLRAQYAQRSVSGSSSSLVALSDWFSKLNTARGFRAISRAQLPLQLARASTTPAPGATVEKTAGDKVFTDPPGPPDLAQTLDVQITPEIQALAQSLGGPIAIRNWVYDHIEFMPTFGSIQGSALTLLNRRGNAFDIASLTLALLRSSGTPSRYVRSVVEVPVEQVQNWLGKVSTPEMALDLMQKGGIPSAAVIQGGRIQAIRFEHVWIEAWVDFIPSRGAINRVPDQWVPLDVAFKQFDYQDAVPWRDLTKTPREDLVREFAQRLTVGPNKSVSGFDFDFASQRMSEIALNLASVLTVTAGGNPVRFVDERTIRPIDSLILEGSLPFPLRSTSIQRYSELPVATRQTVRIRFYTDQVSLNLDSPARDVVIPLVRLGTQRLAVKYIPQTPADAQAIAQYADSNAETMPIGQINVFPRLLLGSEVLFEHGAGRMGTLHFWKADIRDANGNSTETEAYRFAAGSSIVFGADLAGMEPERVERESVNLPDNGSVETSEALYFGGQLYWMLHDHTDELAARSVGGRRLRLPSIGAFAQPLQVRYFFGVPRTGFVTGRVTDVKAVRLALTAANASGYSQAAIKLGSAGSMAEGAAWTLLAGTYKSTLGLSSTTLLKMAIDDGQRIFQIDASNVNAALAELQLSADAENEIRQAAQSGLVAVAPERELTFRGWSGSGYVIVDPATGNSLQRVDGGFAGGIEVECAKHAVLLDSLIRAKILKRATEYLQALPITDNQRALALAGLTKLYAEAAPQVVLPIIAGVSLDVSISLAVGEVNRWVQGVIDGSEKLTPAELSQLGIFSLVEVACSQPHACGAEGPGSFGAGGPLLSNPVAVGTGAKWQFENDFQGSGPFPLSFTRSYVSAAARTDNWIGAKWTASYFQSLRLPPAANGGLFPVNQRPKNVLLQRPGGSWLQFNWRGTGYVTDANLPGHLERLTQGGNTSGWVYTNTADLKELYDASGRLLSISNRAGLAHTLTYDSQFRPTRVTDSFGRTLKFEYDPTTGYLASFRDPLDQLYEFEHDVLGNLTQVRYPDTHTRQYHYTDLNHRYQLTGLTDERGIAVSTWTYDHQGRATSHEYVGGVGRYTFRYGKDKTIVVDPLGKERTYEYERIFGRLYLNKVSQLCTSCGGVTAETYYDARGQIRERRDFRGVVTRYTRDDRGMVTQMIEAFGTPEERTTTTTWHPQWYLPTQIVAPSATGTQTITLAYDPEGNLERRTVNASGQIREWAYTYNGNGQMLTMNGPRTDVNDVSTFTYDEDGNRESATDAAGHATQFLDYDPAGRLLKVRDSNAVISETSYHPRGWLLTQTVRANANGSPSTADAVTSMEYDATGDLKRTRQPDGIGLEYCRDGVRRITAIVSRDSGPATRCNGPMPMSGTENITYQLNSAGDRTREDVHDASGALKRVLARQYNEVGQLRAQINAPYALATDLDDSGVLKTGFTYDGNGNQLTLADELGRIVGNQYDELSRLTHSTQDADDGNPATTNIKATVEYTYDAADNLRRVIDPNLLVTDYAYNGLNNLQRINSPDVGSMLYEYDDAGNRTTQVDARGVRTVYRYDVLDRLSFIEYPSEPAKTVQFRYDQNHADCDTGERNGQNQMTEMIDVSGSSKFCYDHRGNLTRKLQVTSGRNFVVRYRYNVADRLMGTIYPSGLDLSLTRDPLGRIQTATVTYQGTSVPIVDDLRHMPFGPVQSVAFDNGQTLTKRWDQNYWPDAITSPAFNYDFTTNPVGNIISIDSSSDPARVYGYDRLNRLEAVRQINQTLIESYAYDATGNRTERVENSVTETLSYPNTPPSPVLPGSPNYALYSHRLQSVGSVPRTYDAVGNTLSGMPALTAANAQSEYDARNRLTGIRIGPGNYISQYEYNGRGERVAKDIGVARDLYAYDESGQLLGRYRSNSVPGADWTLDEELMWLDNQPVAIVRIESNQLIVRAILSDHLNTPRALTTLHGGNQPAGTTVWKWGLTAKDANSNNGFGTDPANEDPDANGTAVRFDLRFPGQQYDPETGLHYNYFRDYEPATGRYFESDPIGLGGGVSTYGYAGGAPTTLVDPLGLDFWVENGQDLHQDFCIGRTTDRYRRCYFFALTPAHTDCCGDVGTPVVNILIIAGDAVSGTLGVGNGQVHEFNEPVPGNTVSSGSYRWTSRANDMEMSRAMDMMIKKGDWSHYNVVFNNCRSFAWAMHDYMEKHFPNTGRNPAFGPQLCKECRAH